MASQKMGLVPTQRTQTNITSHMLFHAENPVRFPGTGDPGSKPGFMVDSYFSPELRRSGAVISEAKERRGGGDGGPGSHSSVGDDDDGEDDEGNDDDDEDGGDDAVEGLVRIGEINSHSSGAVDKNGGSSARQIIKDGVVMQPEDGNRASTSVNGQQGRSGPYNQMVTIAGNDSDMYYSPLFRGIEGSSRSQKDAARDNECGFSGRKDGSGFSGPAESLRAIFSDPITGALMDDAMILPCGHSFGGGGIQQVMKMRACYTCSRPVSEDTVRPNLSLRTAVQAFRREEDLLLYNASKRRRERFEQYNSNHGDPRARRVHFPFSVTDRVIIKGNKRTPLRFVGREAIVTSQCLNGWYVVKTLDNAESVKVQYRSLAKASDSFASRPTPDKMTPNWL
ncbi:hypothetical protein RND81_10G090500 [Saponaria officinalis]|uniref:U-box domain-containing protein n=1 Tax=Saponaria officinalis TaxID=3572 RepID=A0AAW1I052_SAPOF